MPALLQRRTVIRFQISQRVLNPSAEVLEHWRHGIDPPTMPVPFVEHAPLTLATDITERVIGIASGDLIP